MKQNKQNSLIGFFYESTKSIYMKALALCAILPFGLNAQQTYTFTNGAASGSVGPTQAQVNTAYFGTNLAGAVTINTLGIQQWTVPYSGGYRIKALGAQGGVSWGYGASMQGDFTLTAGSVLNIVVGQAGGSANASHGSGGGGSYVAVTGATVPLVVAGGGGGRGASSGTTIDATSHGATVTAGQSPPSGGPGGVGGGGGAAGASTTGGTSVTPGGASPSSVWASGGGGFYTNGGACNTGSSPGGRSYLNLCLGGDQAPTAGNTAGGFGGAGGNGDRGAGGGGYSGGGAGTSNSEGGGGGGSFNSGANQSNIGGFNTGMGRVLITELCNITLNASTPTPSAPAICSGSSVTLTTNAASGYTWSTGNTTNTSIVVSPATTTTYSVAGTSTANCFATNFITVTVSPGVPVLSIASSTTNLCLGKSATLTASGALTYTWTGGVTNGLGFAPAATGSYTVSGQNGCGISTAVASITVAPLPVTAIVTPTSVCAGSTATLNAASAVTGYTWSPGPLIGGNVVVGPVATTVYTVVASDGTCSGVAFVTLATKPIPTLAVVANSTLVCQGSPVTLTASGAVSYTWSNPANVTGAVITANPSGPTLYQVVGSNSLGCTAQQSQIVLTNPSPTVSISTNKSILCVGDVANLLAGGSGATSYAWTNGPATTGYTVNPTTSTVYSVVGTGLGCTTTQTINIAVILSNLSTVTSNTSICNGGSATLTASGANSYLWVGFVPGTSAVVTPTASTVYTVNAVTTASSISCPSSANISITVFNNPTVSIAATKTVMCKADSGPKLTASGALTYTWNNNATTSTLNVAPTITANTYSVIGTDGNGCVNSSLITIKVNTCTGINGIPANGKTLIVYPNPSNGEFTITGDSDIQLKIVNELGQEVDNIKLSSQNDYKVSLSHLANGIYFILGQNEDGTINQKIIVSK